MLCPFAGKFRTLYSFETIVLRPGSDLKKKKKVACEPTAVNQFCQEANPQDEFFMIVFSDQPRLANDFTTMPEDLEKELLFTQPQGKTSLLDAI